MSHLIHIASRLWHDTRAQAQIEGYIMLVAAVCIGCIVGVVAMRGYVLQEFGNAAEALEHIDQSYAIEVRVGDTTVYSAAYEDPGARRSDSDSDLPACMEFTAPVPEQAAP